MEIEQLKIYLKHICELEKQRRINGELIRDINYQYESLNNYQYETTYALKDFVFVENEKQKLILGVLICVGILVGGYRIGMSYGGNESDFIHMALGAVMGIFIYAGVKFFWMEKENYEIEKVNSKIQQRNIDSRVRVEKMKALLKQEYEEVKKKDQKVQQILGMYYSKDIIYYKYRNNIIAVSSFYEYLCSGRCAQLEGANGAYNLYESEVRQDMIINKLDMIGENLERIKENQFVLYTVLSDSNKKIEVLADAIYDATERLEDIENDTNIIAYNSEITARNSEIIKWIELWDR